jgi:hypothetical protein
MGYKKSRSGAIKVKQDFGGGLTNPNPRNLSMAKHNGYDLIRPMFVNKKLNLFSQIFTFDLVPKTVVAEDLGKEKGRFNKLIDNPNGFIYQEIRRFSSWCNMTPFEMGILIETEHLEKVLGAEKQKPEKYGAIKQMVIDKQITNLEGIIKYFNKSIIAKEIGRKASTLDGYLKNVDNFPVRDIRAIGELFDLKLSEMLILVAAQYAEQMHKHN